MRFLIILLLSLNCLHAENKMKLRFKCISVPVELAQKMNLGLLPSNFGEFKTMMSNKEFSAFLKEVQKDKRVVSLFDKSEPFVSGKTMFIRDWKEALYHKGYLPVYKKVSSDVDKENKAVIEFTPENGKVREVGLKLEATVTLEPDSPDLRIEYQAQVLNFKAMASYTKGHQVKMPVLRALTQETRISLKMDHTVLSMCVYDSTLNQTIKVLSRNENEKKEACLLFFMSAEADEEIPSVEDPLRIELQHLHYAATKIEINQKLVDKFESPNKEFLSGKDIRVIREALAVGNAKILSINTGIALSGCTTHTKNAYEAFLPNSFDTYNLKGKAVQLPNFSEPEDLGSILEFLPQLDPDGKNVECEIRNISSSAAKWEFNKKPVLKNSKLESRYFLETEQVLIMDTSIKKKESDRVEDRKIIMDLLYIKIQ